MSGMLDGGGPTVVVKVASSGDVYVDGKQVGIQAMLDALTELKARGGTVTYYRESPRTEPANAVGDVFRRIMDTQVAVRLGHQSPSEWGRLEWIEAEETPHRWRFFLARGERFMVAYTDSAGTEPATYVGGPMSEEDEDRWAGQVDLLVRSDRVMETPPAEPHLAFRPEAMRERGLHLRVSYGPDRRWTSRYRAGEVPSHIRAFAEDLNRVGHHLVASTDKSSWKELDAIEAEKLF
jgi:hypothetical protein